eukprot:COSAG01_NODE_1806_length_9192_cov_11.433410_12_plen_230_part_00
MRSFMQVDAGGQTDAVSAAEPTADTATASTADNNADPRHRRTVLAAVLPHLFATLLAGGAVMFVARVARNFSAEHTLRWLISAGGSLLLQFFVVDPLQLWLTAPFILWVVKRKRRSKTLSVISVTLDPLSRFRRAARRAANIMGAISDVQTTLLMRAADEVRAQAQQRMDHWHEVEKQATLTDALRQKLRRKHVCAALGEVQPALLLKQGTNCWWLPLCYAGAAKATAE